MAHLTGIHEARMMLVEVRREARARQEARELEAMRRACRWSWLPQWNDPAALVFCTLGGLAAGIVLSVLR